jgi:hypothetical protein
VRPWIVHAHGAGWEEAWEIYAFADSIVKGGAPLLSLGRPQVDPKDGLVLARCKGDLKNASICYTTSGGQGKDRRWANIACRVGMDEVIANQRLPEGTTAFVVNAYDKRDGLVNSELMVIKP